jgi:hypothetical protein
MSRGAKPRQIHGNWARQEVSKRKENSIAHLKCPDQKYLWIRPVGNQRSSIRN